MGDWEIRQIQFLHAGDYQNIILLVQKLYQKSALYRKKMNDSKLMQKQILYLKILLFLFLAVLVFPVNAQSDKAVLIDSLESSVKKQSQADSNTVKLYFELFEVYSTINNDSAIYYLKKAQSVSRQVGYTYGLVKSLNLIGKARMYAGENDSAFNYHLQAGKLAQEHNFKDQQSLANIGMGLVHRNFGDHKSAVSYFEKALAIAEELPEADIKLRALNCLAAASLDQGNFEKAIRQFEEVLQLRLERGDSNSIASAYNNLAVTMRGLKEYDKSINYYKKAIEYKKGYQSDRNLTFFYLNLAEAYFLTGKYDSCYIYLQKGKEMNESQGLIEAKLGVYGNLALYYASNDSQERAVEYLDLYYKTVDSMKSRESIQQIADLRVHYETEKKEIKIAQLNREKAQRNKWITILVFFSITLAGLLVAVFYQLKQRKVAYKALLNKNLEIVRIHKRHPQTNPLNDDVTEVTSDAGEETEWEKDQSTVEKYKSSGMSDKARDKILEDLLYKLKKEKIYLQSDITVDRLATMLETNNKYISRVINEEFNTSFINLINEYRVNKARELMTDSKTEHFTMEAVAYDVGFNSVSTFNRAFKKVTGLVPSQYKKLLQDEQQKSQE